MVRKELLGLLLLAIFLSGCITTSTSPSVVAPTTDAVVNAVCSGKMTFLPDWQAIAVYALLASVSLLSAMYIFSIIFNNPNLNAFVKFEVYELLTTVVITIAVLAIVQSVCLIDISKIFPDLTSGYGQTNIYQLSFDYLQFLDARMIGWMTANHMVTMAADQLASSTIYAKPLGLGLVTSPGSGLAGPIKNVLNQITSALAVAFIINHAQIAVLQFTTYGLLNYYLPIGIILRCFTPTRRLGGTLIALTIGFLLIYPLLTVITAEIVQEPIRKIDGSIWSSMGSNLMPGLEKIFTGQPDYNNWVANSVTGGEMVKLDGTTQPVGSNAPPPGTTPSVGAELGVTTIIWNMFSGFGKGIIYGMLMIPMSAVATAFAAGFIMPALNILILVQAIRALSKTLGDEIDISTLTRMI